MKTLHTAGTPLLEIENLSVVYETDTGVVHAVDDLNIRLEQGKTLGFVGETGAGKTTTARAILRIIQSPPGKITGGRILFEGMDLLSLTDEEMRSIRGGRISMIFQDPMTSLNPVMPVDEQIAEMVRLHADVSAEEARARAVEMLRMVGIRPDRAGDYPHQFSGGMRQRVVIAVALACTPALLIADEPTTALDVTIQAQVLELIKELQKKVRTSMILITHDMGIVAEICDEVAIVYAGSVVEYAPIDPLFERPLHPYTRGLFRAIPDITDDSTAAIEVIPGTPPDPTDPPKGCSFSPRCSRAKDVCFEKRCGMREALPGHFVDCYFPLLEEEDALARSEGGAR